MFVSSFVCSSFHPRCFLCVYWMFPSLRYNWVRKWLGIYFKSCCKCAKYAQKMTSIRKYLVFCKQAILDVHLKVGRDLYSVCEYSWLGRGHIMIVSHRESRCLQLLKLMTATWCKERGSWKMLVFMFAFSPQALGPSQWEKRDRSLQSQQESVARKRFSKIVHVFCSFNTQPVNSRNYQPNWTRKLLSELGQ